MTAVPDAPYRIRSSGVRNAIAELRGTENGPVVYARHVMMSGSHKRRGGRQRVCEANEQRRRPAKASPEPPHKDTAEWLD